MLWAYHLPQSLALGVSYIFQGHNNQPEVVRKSLKKTNLVKQEEKTECPPKDGRLSRSGKMVFQTLFGFQCCHGILKSSWSVLGGYK